MATNICMNNVKKLDTSFGTLSSLVSMLSLYALHTSTKISKVSIPKNFFLLVS